MRLKWQLIATGFNSLRQRLPEEIVDASSSEIFKLRLDARWQSLFPEPVPRYPDPNLFHSVLSHTHAMFVKMIITCGGAWSDTL